MTILAVLYDEQRADMSKVQVMKFGDKKDRIRLSRTIKWCFAGWCDT